MISRLRGFFRLPAVQYRDPVDDSPWYLALIER
jgi:hypothetical protein